VEPLVLEKKNVQIENRADEGPDSGPQRSENINTGTIKEEK
jgi:hypothetical protein